MLIDDLSLYRGRLKRSDYRLVRDWASANRRLLEDEWAKFNG